MSLINVLVAVITGLFGIIILVAAAVAVARTGFAKAQIEALRGDRDDLLTRVQMLETENLRVGDALKNERDARKVLERVVTGKEQLDHIQSTIDTFIDSTVTWRKEQRAIGLNVLGLLGGQRDGETNHDPA